MECGLVMSGVAQEAAVKVNHSQVTAQVVGSPREGLQGGDALRKGAEAGTGHFVAENLTLATPMELFWRFTRSP